MDRLLEGMLGSRTPRGPHALALPATRLARAGARAGGGPSAHPRGPNVYPNSEANVKQPHTAIAGSSSLIKVKIVKLVNDINKRYPQKMTLTLPFLRKSSRAKTGLREPHVPTYSNGTVSLRRVTRHATAGDSCGPEQLVTTEESA